MVSTTVSGGAEVSDTGSLLLRGDAGHGHVGLARDADGRLGGATAVGDELVLEAHDRRGDRRDRRGAERADGGLLRRPGDPGADVVAHVEQQADVFRAAVAVEHAAHDLLEPARALAARRALAAALPRSEEHTSALQSLMRIS